MKIAVIGAGIFGITIASKLAADSHDVHLFEKQDDILTSASGINQFRIHKGYHYPRSPETVKSLLKSVNKFEEYFDEAILKGASHYYCIAHNNSLTTPEQYLSFCEENELPYKECNNFLIRNVDLCVRVEENLLDYERLKSLCFRMLDGVKSHFGVKFVREQIGEFDLVVNCTYAAINELLPEGYKRTYQYEICEKIVVKLPDRFQGQSIVIMDGPFMCLDPYGQTGNFLLGNVVHAIHSTNVGHEPKIPRDFLHRMNKGIWQPKEIVEYEDVGLNCTRFNEFIKSATYYVPLIEEAEYVGSMFTVRTVLPYIDDTDARPTMVENINGNIINVFSGKIDTCVMAAEEVVGMVK